MVENEFGVLFFIIMVGGFLIALSYREKWLTILNLIAGGKIRSFTET